MITNLDAIVDKCLAESNVQLKKTWQSSTNLSLHRAIESDMESVFKLVYGLAEYVKEADAVKVNADTYVRDGFKSSPPLFHCILLIDHVSGKKCGIASWYIGYSTLEGPFLYLEDLFILKEYRGGGAGTCIMRTLAKISISLQCQKFVWQALDWNTSGLDFYQNINAIILPDRTLRMDRVAIQKFLFSFEDLIDGVSADLPSKTNVKCQTIQSDNLDKVISLSMDKVNRLLSKQISQGNKTNFRVQHIWGEDVKNAIPFLKKGKCEVNSEAFLRNSIDGMSPVYNCMTIEDTSTHDIIGFCVWHLGYSTWEGRTIQISNTFIKDKLIELQLLKYVMYAIASVAQSLDCIRLVWNDCPREESDDNKEKFYDDLGAITLKGLLTLNLTHLSMLEFVKN